MRTLTRERALEQMIKTNRQIEESLGKNRYGLRLQVAALKKKQ